jgi:hypothetical protein
MSKLLDIVNSQVDNKHSALNNFLTGKPIATTDVGLETGTIIKITVGILALGIVLMLFYKYIVVRK